MTDAPLRFGERGSPAAPMAAEERSMPGADAVPAGPPKLREPAEEALVPRRERHGTSDEAEVEPAARPEPTGRVEATPAPKPAPAPGDAAAQSRRSRKQVARRRARKVKRIIRRFDAWSVMKVSFIFYLCMYVVTLVALVAIWNVADRAGAIENVEGFIESVGFESFEFVPDQLFEATALGGAILAVLATALTALAAVLFNLISDLVGGIRLTVIEEPGSMPARRRGSVGSKPEDPATVSEPSTGL